MEEERGSKFSHRSFDVFVLHFGASASDIALKCRFLIFIRTLVSIRLGLTLTDLLPSHSEKCESDLALKCMTGLEEV